MGDLLPNFSRGKTTSKLAKRKIHRNEPRRRHLNPTVYPHGPVAPPVCTVRDDVLFAPAGACLVSAQQTG